MRDVEPEQDRRDSLDAIKAAWAEYVDRREHLEETELTGIRCVFLSMPTLMELVKALGEMSERPIELTLLFEDLVASEAYGDVDFEL